MMIQLSLLTRLGFISSGSHSWRLYRADGESEKMRCENLVSTTSTGKPF